MHEVQRSPKSITQMNAFMPPCVFGVTSQRQQQQQQVSRISARRTSIQCSLKEKKKKKAKVIELTDEQAAGWETVRSRLMDEMGFEVKTADKVITRAFGWGKSKYWRNVVKNETPNVEIVESRIKFLKHIVGFDDDALPSTIKQFPEVIRLPIERMEQNLEYIRTNFPVLAARPDALKLSLIEQPHALGNDVDCGGDCAGMSMLRCVAFRFARLVDSNCVVQVNANVVGFDSNNYRSAMDNCSRMHIFAAPLGYNFRARPIASFAFRVRYYIDCVLIISHF